MTRVSKLKAGETFEICSRKKGGVTGKVVVRTLRRNPGAESQPTNQAGNYPASSSQSNSYPAAGGGGYPAPANSVYQANVSGGSGFPPPANYQPATGVYPTLPQGGAPGSATLPYPVQPGPGMVHQGQHPSPGPYPGQGNPTGPYPGQANSGRKNSQGLISQMAATVRPANPGGAGGFRLP